MTPCCENYPECPCCQCCEVTTTEASHGGRRCVTKDCPLYGSIDPVIGQNMMRLISKYHSNKFHG